MAHDHALELVLSADLGLALEAGQFFKHDLGLELGCELATLGHCVSPFLD